MLTSLAIHRIGVIDEALLEFGPGFTAITGETGAGKTMVVTGLGLLMGRRLDSRRAGISSTVEGRVHVNDAPRIRERLDELGADVDDDGEVLAVRRVTKDGRSRAHIGGVPVPVATLAEIVGGEITIHGQSDQLRLKDPEAQLEALDAVISEEGRRLLSEHRATFSARSALAAEERALSRSLENRDRRHAELTDLLESIAAADTYDGEDDELRQEIDALASAEDTMAALDEVLMALAGDEHASVLTFADRAATALGKLGPAQGADDPVAQTLNRVIALRDEASDIARTISLLRDDSQASPGRLAEAQERLHVLTTLVRDIGPRIGGAATVTEVMEASRSAVQDLQNLEGGAQRLEDISRERAALDEELASSAAALTGHRAEAADRLARMIEDELAGLEMPGASVRIDMGEAAVGPTGADTVTFTLRPHPGADFMPLATGASGGELSRVMLALEVAIAELSQKTSEGSHPVFIFDEIDAGIGGRAARAVGERLARLAASAQVIVVTHLPQVASFAGTHLHIVKETVTVDGGEVTRSHVRSLDTEARVQELARMLAGDTASETALEHARELLELTAGEKP